MTNSDISITESELDDKSTNFFHCDPDLISDPHLEQDSASRNSFVLVNKRTFLPISQINNEDSREGSITQSSVKDMCGNVSIVDDSSRHGYIEYSTQAGDSEIPEAFSSDNSPSLGKSSGSVIFPKHLENKNECDEVVFEFSTSKRCKSDALYQQSPKFYSVISDSPVSFEFGGSHSSLKLSKQNEPILFTPPMFSKYTSENYMAKSLDDLLTFKDRKFESILTPNGYVVPLDKKLYKPCYKETEDVDKHTYQ